MDIQAHFRASDARAAFIEARGQAIAWFLEWANRYDVSDDRIRGDMWAAGVLCSDDQLECHSAPNPSGERIEGDLYAVWSDDPTDALLFDGGFNPRGTGRYPYSRARFLPRNAFPKTYAAFERMHEEQDQ